MPSSAKEFGKVRHILIDASQVLCPQRLKRGRKARRRARFREAIPSRSGASDPRSRLRGFLNKLVDRLVEAREHEPGLGDLLAGDAARHAHAEHEVLGDHLLAFKSSVTEPSVMRIRRSLFCVIVAAEVPIPK